MRRAFFTSILLTVLAAGSAQAGTIVNVSSLDAVNRITSYGAFANSVDTSFFSSYRDDAEGPNHKQNSLVYTSNTTFSTALSAVLGPLGEGQKYQINGATFVAGTSSDDFGLAIDVHQLLVPFNSGTVTWNNFSAQGDGGTPGEEYASTALATGVINGAGFGTTSWSGLESLVQDWLDGDQTNNGLIFTWVKLTSAPRQNESFTASGNTRWVLDAEIVAVPEPSSVVLLGLGSLCGLGALRRRRRGNCG